jgi:hypothetical protein
MPQVTIYLDSSSERRAKSAAKAAGLSVSRWIALLIEEKSATTWPPEVAALAGAWPDFPTAEELRKGQSGDVIREAI